MSAAPYASKCTLCLHLATQHRLSSGGDVVAGPYACTVCGCSRPRDGHYSPMTQAAFEKYRREMRQNGHDL